MTQPLNHRTRIKICGLTRESDVEAAVSAGADAIGFVLYAKSPRYVSLARAAELARALPPFVTPVLLLVDAPENLVRDALSAIPQGLLQFHGHESPDDCVRYGHPYLGVARMTSDFDLLDFSLRHPQAQAVLVDAFVDGFGGGGKVFDWTLLPARLSRPLILSGGLNPDNVAQGIEQVRPWGVDVSSGVERTGEKGVKDAGLMRLFCQAVRAADQRNAQAG